MKPLRIYLDTSVLGGCEDPEFAEDSLRLIERVRLGRFTALLSDVVIRELRNAPLHVKEILHELPKNVLEEVRLTDEILDLAAAYLDAGVLGHGQRDDAIHVAAATVARADAIVSWNFKHIVRLDKIKAYNQVNLLKGYGVLTVLSPKETQCDEGNQQTSQDL